MKLLKDIFNKLFGRPIAKFTLTALLRSTITDKNYSEAEEILIDNQSRLSKRYYKEWKQQIEIARNGKVNVRKIDKDVFIHAIFTVFFSILIGAVTMTLSYIIKLNSVSYIIMYGLPLWFVMSSGWISRHYRMKYGFQIYDKEFHHVRADMTIVFISCDIFALFS